MNDVRGERVAAHTEDNAAGTTDILSSDNLLKILVAVRGSALPKDVKVELRDQVLSFAQEREGEGSEAAANALKEVLRVHADVVNPALGLATPKAKEEPAASGFGRTRPRPVFAEVNEGSTARKEVEPATPKPAPLQKPVVKEAVRTVAPKTPEPETVPLAESRDIKTRIAEIKRSVNERIGNPVNLIERNSEIGREYMTALLEAIKYSAGGNATGGSMNRLEAAYVAVTRLLDAPAEHVTPPPSKPAPPKEEVPLPKKERSEIPVAPVSVGREEVVSKRVPSKIPLADIPRIEDMRPVPAQSKTQFRSLAAAVRDIPEPRTRAAMTEPTTEETLRMPSEPVRKATAQVRPPVPSQRTEGPAGVESSPEVAAGLEQLLSEWKLFRRSGMFGTGPHGSSHPLYKQLAQLPLAAVIAGRFEGATPEVKQSITDYMNGWRYEYTIVHKMEETFEHYLRRVIASILAKQKLNKKQPEQSPTAPK